MRWMRLGDECRYFVSGAQGHSARPWEESRGGSNFRAGGRKRGGKELLGISRRGYGGGGSEREVVRRSN